jgi:Lon protease-like protein
MAYPNFTNMTKFIPIFPLNIVVFPREKLNLHIFEPRYKQLIQDCYDEKKLFGIPSVIKSKLGEYGTSIEILSIQKVHENGEMDIKTQGVEIFKLLELIEPVPNKLYNGAVVNFPMTHYDSNPEKMTRLLEDLRHFHKILQVSKKYDLPDDELKSFDIAHHVGLSVEQEYDLLQLSREQERQEYLERHLRSTIPTLIELQNLKERIQLNGHFRKLSISEDE